jgi:hypothetical protein
MSYIKSRDHFLNYLNKIAKEINIGMDETCSGAFILENIFYKGLADRFAWDVKQDPGLLFKEKLIDWVVNANNKSIVFRFDFAGMPITDEFDGLTSELKDVPGVYFFRVYEIHRYSYIGMSKDLGSRMVSSFKERFEKTNDLILLSHIKTKSYIDAAMLELYFINKYNPSLNLNFNDSGILTLNIGLIPEISDEIACNKITR